MSDWSKNCLQSGERRQTPEDSAADFIKVAEVKISAKTADAERIGVYLLLPINDSVEGGCRKDKLYYSLPRICLCLAKYASGNNLCCYYEGRGLKSENNMTDIRPTVDKEDWSLRRDLLGKMAARCLAVPTLHATLDIVSPLKAPAFTFMCISSSLPPPPFPKLARERALSLTFTGTCSGVLSPRRAAVRTGREDADC